MKNNKKVEMMLNMFRTVLNMLFGNSVLWNANVPLTQTYNSLEAAVGNLEATMDEQTKPTTPYTNNKKAKKFEMAELANVMREKVQAYASGDGLNPELYDEMEITISDIKGSSGLMAKILAQRIYDAANAMSMDARTMYSISDVDMEMFVNSIATYNALLNMPRIKISQRKTLTASVGTQVKAIDKVLKTKMDKLMATYKPINFEFWEDYINARAEMNPAYKIAHITGETVDMITKTPIYGVKVKAVSKGKNKGLVFEDMTNTAGDYMLKEISPEVYDVTFEVPGYVPFVKRDIAIRGGEHIDLANIELTPVSS